MSRAQTLDLVPPVLVVVAGKLNDDDVARFALDRDRTTVGRSDSCDAVIASERISSEHCAVERRDDAWFVVDLGSSNGTFINGTIIDNATQVEHGDRIRLGRIVELEFRTPVVEASVDSDRASNPALSRQSFSANWKTAWMAAGMVLVTWLYLIALEWQRSR